MRKIDNTGDFKKHLSGIYGGMCAGLMFLASIATTFGLTTSVSDLGRLLILCLSSALVCLLVYATTEI